MNWTLFSPLYSIAISSAVQKLYSLLVFSSFALYPVIFEPTPKYFWPWPCLKTPYYTSRFVLHSILSSVSFSVFGSDETESVSWLIYLFLYQNHVVWWLKLWIIVWDQTVWRLSFVFVVCLLRIVCLLFHGFQNRKDLSNFYLYSVCLL